MADRKVIFRVPAISRMFERVISADDVQSALQHGEVIEEYPDDAPYPSRLLLGWAGPRPLHIVMADYTQEETSIIITVYEPNEAQ